MPITITITITIRSDTIAAGSFRAGRGIGKPQRHKEHKCVSAVCSPYPPALRYGTTLNRHVVWSCTIPEDVVRISVRMPSWLLITLVFW